MRTQIQKIVTSRFIFASALTFAFVFCLTTARADETCSSPYLARIEGQEEFVYVWTLGVEGLGDGSDKLVTVDVKPGSPNYGKVIYSHSVGGRNEAHHGGFTDDRRQLWLSGLESSKIFIFDVHTDPAKPSSSKRSRISRKPPAAQSDRTAPMRCPVACSFHVSRTRRTKAGAPRSSNTATTAITSPRTGCRQRTTRWRSRARSSPTVTAMTHACCRAKTCCSPHRSPA